MDPAAIVPPPEPCTESLARAAGRAELGVKWNGTETRLAHALEEGAAKLRFPRGAEPGRFEAVWINSAGGLTDGDRLSLQVRAAAKARILITTQAAEKVYRARRGMAPARLSIAIEAGAGSDVEWLPQETILFDQGRIARSLAVELADNATLLAIESTVLGRTARGERVLDGFLEDRWRIRRSGRLVWADTMRLAGPIAALAAERAILDGAHAFGTLLYVGADAPDWTESMRDWCAALPVRAGVSNRGEVLAARLLAADGDRLRPAMASLLTAFRSARRGATVPLPRVWAC